MTDIEKIYFVLEKLNYKNISPDWLLIKKTIHEDDLVWIKAFLLDRKYIDNENHITFDGIEKLEEINKYKIIQSLQEEMRTFQKASASKMEVLTVVLAIGSIGLLIWEIIKYFCDCTCHPIR